MLTAVAAVALIGTTGLAADRTAPLDVSREAVQRRIEEAVDYLASDELEGRGVRTRGLDLAADYLHEQFREAGLRTDVYAGEPFQKFRLFSRATKGAVQELAFELAGEEPVALKRDENYTSLTLSLLDQFKLPVVFAGYGITAPDLGYDDYAGINVAGAAVIILRHEPQQGDPDSVFNGLENSEHAFLRPKIDNAIRHGASVIIFCTDDYALRHPADENAQPQSADSEELIKVELEESSLQGSAPVVHCRRDVIEKLIEQSLGEELIAIEERIDAALEPQSRRLTKARVSGRVALSRDGRSLRNVIAAVDGSGELAEETVVIGAHYDHLGRGGWGSLAIGANEEIHNGADDNASGTAVLLEVARQLAAHPEPLKRRVLFIAFSAEELGLIGSKRYVDDPAVPLDQT
ncbi:MAG: M20/M25/M40 family metallo-hydrolase, partial [Planctomycetota bacterium]